MTPRGWVPLTPFTVLANQSYGEAFAVSALLHLLDIRDALDRDRFIPVSAEGPTPPQPVGRSDFRDIQQPILGGRSVSDDVRSVSEEAIVDDGFNYDFTFADHELALSGHKFFAGNPPVLPMEKWAEPDPNSFRLRGKSYKKDRRKINAGFSIGRLIAVDVVRADEPLYETGLSKHPTERMQLALEREKRRKQKGFPSDLPPFVFIVNIVVPGPPYYHGVFYYAIDDMSMIDGTDGTPSSKLCNQFFFGDSDAFREKTFKLIPQIVEGNFIVRKAVGSTPAIMGTKLRQLYVRGDRFFEVICDCCSSSVATGVIRLSLGYAKTLVVDMGFLFEGTNEATLPERILGCVRIKNISMGPHLRKVEQPPPQQAPPAPVTCVSIKQ